LAHNFHVRLYINQNGRLDEVPAAGNLPAAYNGLRTLVCAGIQISANALKLFPGNKRPLVGFGIDARSNVEFPGLFSNAVDDFVEDAFMHEQARARGATLTLVEEDGGSAARNRSRYVGICEHNIGRL